MYPTHTFSPLTLTLWPNLSHVNSGRTHQFLGLLSEVVLIIKLLHAPAIQNADTDGWQEAKKTQDGSCNSPCCFTTVTVTSMVISFFFVYKKIILLTQCCILITLLLLLLLVVVWCVCVFVWVCVCCCCCCCFPVELTVKISLEISLVRN